MTTQIDVHATDLLEAMYEADQDGSDQDEAISTYLQRAGHGSDYGFTLVDLLAGHGMVKAHHTYGRPRGTITPGGMRAVQQLRLDRANPKIRAALLRNSMVAWLDEQEEYGVYPNSFDEFVESLEQPFSKRELHGAAEYLESQGLIEAPNVPEFSPGWVGPRLTAKGRECITDYDGDVADYVRDRAGARPASLDRSVADDIWST